MAKKKRKTLSAGEGIEQLGLLHTTGRSVHGNNHCGKLFSSIY